MDTSNSNGFKRVVMGTDAGSRIRASLRKRKSDRGPGMLCYNGKLDEEERRSKEDVREKKDSDDVVVVQKSERAESELSFQWSLE